MQLHVYNVYTHYKIQVTLEKVYTLIIIIYVLIKSKISNLHLNMLTVCIRLFFHSRLLFSNEDINSSLMKTLISSDVGVIVA